MEERNNRHIFTGVVVSDKMAKTIIVLVETHKKHTKYEKRVKYGKKYVTHDELGAAHVGDTVEIMETRPLSATKRYRLLNIVKKAVSDVELKEGE